MKLHNGGGRGSKSEAGMFPTYGIDMLNFNVPSIWNTKIWYETDGYNQCLLPLQVQKDMEEAPNRVPRALWWYVVKYSVNKTNLC